MAVSVRLFPAVSVLSCLLTAVCARRHVLELGDADFDYLAAEHETMLVMFYAPWCGHCKKLAPEFEKAATRLKGTVQLAKVSSSSSSYGLCPHMTVENRDRLRVRDLLTAYYDLDYHHNARGSNYWRNRVMKVGSNYAGRGLTFSVANKKDFLSELEDDFGLGTSDGGELPFVTIRTKLGHKYTMREEFTRDGQSLQRFLEDYFAGRLKRYVKSEPVPEKNSAAVQVVVAESFDDVVNDPDKDVLIQFYSPSCPHCKKLEPVYRELADALSSDPSIVVSKMNAVDNDVPLGYDVQGYPTIYFAPMGKKDEPIRYEGGRELKDFLKFVKREKVPGSSSLLLSAPPLRSSSSSLRSPLRQCLREDVRAAGFSAQSEHKERVGTESPDREHQRLPRVRREVKSPSELIEDGDGRLGSEEKQLRSRQPSLVFAWSRQLLQYFQVRPYCDFMSNTLRKLGKSARAYCSVWTLPVFKIRRGCYIS
ncbi:Protein disulfide-isomerase A3 [Larimichthys crocea]|uniref:Uncharacterized protein n=1 Tax=Larimichthys crocea TaxID=215358 RepID=A0ACD3RF82_LARCR|nr:Protein disulfide-isomerase A3 [Larimichthys crocea]